MNQALPVRETRLTVGKKVKMAMIGGGTDTITRGTCTRVSGGPRRNRQGTRRGMRSIGRNGAAPTSRSTARAQRTTLGQTWKIPNCLAQQDSTGACPTNQALPVRETRLMVGKKVQMAMTGGGTDTITRGTCARVSGGPWRNRQGTRRGMRSIGRNGVKSKHCGYCSSVSVAAMAAAVAALPTAVAAMAATIAAKTEASLVAMV